MVAGHRNQSFFSFNRFRKQNLRGALVPHSSGLAVGIGPLLYPAGKPRQVSRYAVRNRQFSFDIV
jgi:hypothetical protein